jgi:hypothetical protein
MAGSAADAISHAVERSKQLLFPVKGDKWFALGFTVFLAQCGESGGSVQIPSLPSGSGPSVPSGPAAPGSGATPPYLQNLIDQVTHALHDNLALYVSLAIGGLLSIMGVWIFILWFSSRAKLMFAESVIWDRVDLGAQWTRAADLGLSLFKFRAWFGVASSLLLLSAIAGGVVVALPDLQSGAFFGTRAVIGYSLFGFAILAIGLPLAITLLLLDDFVVPLMVVRNVRVREAWRICRAEVLSGNIGGVILFYLLRFVLSIAVGIAAVILSCVTCCFTAIPYIGTVLMLPIFVFSRSYSLYYLQELGLQIFPLPEPSWVAYDQWRFPR